MKKFFLVISFIIATTTLINAQSIERAVIGNAGETFSANNSYITFTLGETVIEPSPSITFSPASNAMIFSIGFIQPHVASTGSLVNVDNWVSAYPNPTTGWVRLDIHGDNFQVNNVRIINSNGQIVATKPFKMVNGSIDLDFANLAAGVYIVAVTDDIVGRTVTTRIIKQNK
jgi:Secretion system C-terminal sorting domain